jgi:hypothetical protein
MMYCPLNNFERCREEGCQWWVKVQVWDAVHDNPVGYEEGCAIAMIARGSHVTPENEEGEE